MQSLPERRALPISCMNLEKEDDLAPVQVHRNAPGRPNEILHLPRIRSLGSSTQEENGHLQQELFSLKIRNCTLFKAVPLPHISNKMAPCLGDSDGRAGPAKQFLGLLFSPEKDPFEKMFSCFDSGAVAGWQRKARGFMRDLGTWSCLGVNFVQFAHFWLSELQQNQKQQLLELELRIIEDKLCLALRQGSDSRELQPLDFNAVLAAALSEYPTGLVSSQTASIFLDYLNFMSSERTPGYKKMLSSVQYTTQNVQLAQWLLAVRAFVLASLWHAIVKFYKALVNTQISPEQEVQSSVSSAKKQPCDVVKERIIRPPVQVMS
ncbi:salivary gland specific protein SAGSIN1 isoform X3 [Paroedura picta]|uniref:salivary gland specific protein SAGSIN1 isoform X3 n=1 Tax=Paroedura picta TaxID=143630 RepID=UPI004055AC58